MTNPFTFLFNRVYGAFVGILKRNGVNVGTTADYPRVQLHSFQETGPLDKDNNLRSMDLTIDSISNKSEAEAIDMAKENISRIMAEGFDIPECDIIGIVPGLTQTLNEVQDGQPVLYRVLQQFTVYIEKN